MSYEFLDKKGTFKLNNSGRYKTLYMPLGNEAGIKSSITPILSGDSKLDQNHFLLEPVSSIDLLNNRSSRAVWCKIYSESNVHVCENAISLNGIGHKEQEDNFGIHGNYESSLEAGLMWQRLNTFHKAENIRASILSFVPSSEDTVEIMKIEIENTGDEDLLIEPIAAIPLFGRSADNIRDHRHVTSLLHRIYTLEEGVAVYPTLSFDERGHNRNHTQYFVLGAEEDGKKPEGFYPVIEEFTGDGGSLEMPEVIFSKCEENISHKCTDENAKYKSGAEIDGLEALGGICFEKTLLKSHESKTYIIILGFAQQERLETTNVWQSQIEEVYARYNSKEKVEEAFNETITYWNEKQNITFELGNERQDNFMYWVCFQPTLRRLFGCSFLPHHDYGRGGRGWRDLWQDCLALILQDPVNVRRMLSNHFKGVRIDGTNATIIGTHEGEFIADRNQITRVWMDHGMWPFITTMLYMDQTGDIKFLEEKCTYFKDAQVLRGQARDARYALEQGVVQLDVNKKEYKGSVLEHLLIEHLTAFFDVGEHNHMLLHGADWNDAIDMAANRGESVAFTAAYAGNLRKLTALLEEIIKENPDKSFELMEEMDVLLEVKEEYFDTYEKKKDVLSKFCKQVCHEVSGKKNIWKASDIKSRLDKMSKWIMENIQKSEWIEDDECGWYNSYYDDHGRKVEGKNDENVRMMLTGQVFTILSGTASKEETAQIVRAADKYLYKEEIGGYRLNTNFNEVKEDLGRMFGFAYGHKENGAVFSHMAVMYAYALYERGFAKEGFKVIETLFNQANNFEVSKIYPGIPEYFDGNGRGLYHYLTGAASWYVLTMVTKVFGVYGKLGNLCIEPKLIKKQFDKQNYVSMNCDFADKNLKVIYHNEAKAEYGEYYIKKVLIDGKEVSEDKILQDKQTTQMCIIDRSVIESLSDGTTHNIDVFLVK